MAGKNKWALLLQFFSVDRIQMHRYLHFFGDSHAYNITNDTLIKYTDVIKHWPIATCGGKGLEYLIDHSSPRKSGQELINRPWKKMLLTGLLCLFFYVTQDYQGVAEFPVGWACLHQSSNKKMPYGLPYRGVSQLRFLFPNDSKLLSSWH